jgi:DNA-binding winged helix-turn-helix (wHTH) protein/predicted Zn-dependent protease
MAVLVRLATTPRGLVTREELLRCVWPDCENGDQVLTTAVYKLRRAFAASADARPPVETVPRRGYLLAADVETLTSGSTTLEERDDPAFAAGARAAHQRATELLAGPRFDQLEEAIRLLEAATRLWPDFAPAWADLARGYFVLASWGRRPGGRLLVEAAAAALRAHELEPRSTAARVWCAMTHETARWRPGAAAAAIEAALVEDPEDARARDALAHCLAACGRLERAIAEERAALERDPLSPALRTALGFFLRLAERLDEAETELRQALALSPEWSIAHVELGRVLLARGERERAAAEIARAEPMWGRFLGWLARSDREARTRAQRCLVAWLDGSGGAYVAPYWLAERCVWAGSLDAALDQLERALREQQLQLLFVAHEPVFRPLHGRVRFRRLLKALSVSPADPCPPEPGRRRQPPVRGVT